MTNSLPEAEKIHKLYADDERVRVVAVATAFEKEQYPWMADEDKIRARLKAEGWTGFRFLEIGVPAREFVWRDLLFSGIRVKVGRVVCRFDLRNRNKSLKENYY